MSARRSSSAAAVLLSTPLLAGCAFSEGGWFAEVSATLEARLDPHPDRDLGGGWQRLNTDFAIRLDRAELVIEQVELQDLGGGGEALGFDPANPPPGYSLCHGGHCHRDDGALIPYEEIAAELASGGAGARTVAALPVGAADLLAPARRALSCEPSTGAPATTSCGLPRVHLGRARLTPERLVLEGLARDERSPARFAGEVPLELDAELLAGDSNGALTIDAPLDIPTGRDEPPGIDLAMTLVATARLLDDVPFDTLVAAGGLIDLNVPEAADARGTIRQSLAASELVVQVSRHEDP